MNRTLLSVLMLLLVTGCGGVQSNGPTKGAPRGDDQIARDANISCNMRKRLIGDSKFSPAAQSLFVGTVDGVVTIRGAVDSDAEKMRVVEAARKIPNVRGVNAELTPINRTEVH